MINIKQKKLFVGLVMICLIMTAGFSQNALAEPSVDPGYKVYIPLVLQNVDQRKPVEILPGSTTFLDSYNYLHILGEVANHTGNTIWNIQIRAILYDSANNLIGSNTTNMNLTALPANDITCFDISISAASGWDYFLFENPIFDTEGPQIPVLAIFDDQGFYDPVYGWYDITGRVWNNSEQSVNYVSLVGTLYNSAGSVIGCNYTFVDDINLEPYQTSGFDLSFVRRDYYDAARYHLQIDGVDQ